ncbi:MAG: RNA-binding transcriptional accessory protein [Chloroflexi bacterium]|nr:MAG: RNA-binding transcriptional accessory protein [Chloroflexota bacterium]
MTNEQLIRAIAAATGTQPQQVAGAVELLDEGNTIPFIARYRKERTGGLDEEQLRAVAERLAYLRGLDERKQAVLASLAEQEKLTPALEAAIAAAQTLQAVEDIYLPYRPKRRTRATVARELGLEPLAALILAQPPNGKPETAAQKFLSADVPDVEAALAGARDIVAEQMAETAAIRQFGRERFYEKGDLAARLVAEGADEQGKYELYHNFATTVRRVQPHQVLALNRGENEKILRVNIAGPGAEIRQHAERLLQRNPRSPFAGQLEAAVEDGYNRLLAPAIERESRKALTEAADTHAIGAFQKNLRALLLQPPLRGRVVMGIDPAYRTGCKIAICDATGKLLHTTVLYPHPPQNRRAEALAELSKLVDRYDVQAIAIGNGTASRETEQLVADLVAGDRWQVTGGEPQSTIRNSQLAYALVNEAGASVYSASPLARQEFPDLDVSIRGAVSIARRLQDPLAELVKIDPQSIGVGLYQHDVDQKRLAAALDGVVESVVNSVGVNVNTASPALLAQVAGLTSRTAENVVAHRDANGPFRSRAQILKVKGVGPKAYEQAAGFLRIPDGENPLDNTGIHPESYPVVERLAAPFDSLAFLPLDRMRQESRHLSQMLGVGEPTLVDILDALAKPGRDPRDDLPPVQLRADVLSLDDLREGMILTGTVRNVVAFGAFVDIGVKQDGLVHISALADRYVSDPHAVVRVGDVVTVRVLTIDAARGRIGLSMKGEKEEGRKG